MAKLPWIDFINTHPGAHVVVGVSEESDDGSDLRMVASRLAKLIARQGAGGDYSVGIVREGGAPEVFCAFQKQTAADCFAETVKAKPSGRYGGWASQRTFPLDDATMANLDAAVRPQKRK